MSDKKTKKIETKNISSTLKDFKEKIIEKNISEYAENAYLEYAMSVVKGRAIPSVEDGLKNVHRRIVYAMFKEGMTYSSVHKKCARVVGNVLGYYHPHGDQSVYNALVRQAQPFSVRYTLIDGQGNFGSRDGDTAASMRYTEAKLSAITQLYMEEIKDHCVDFIPNYDGSEIEPKVLPARLPFILLNGNPGIGVGMVSDIPHHNLREVVKATILCLENENTTLDEVLEHIEGPDFPTKGQIISSKSEIKKIYSEGKGSIKIRSKYFIETNGKNWKLIFNEIPYGVSGKLIMEQVDAHFNPEDKIKKDSKVKDKKITPEKLRLKALYSSLIDRYNDASDKDNPIRLVFEPKSNKQDPEELAQILLGTTDLETTFSADFTVVGRDGRPIQKTLMEIIFEWISFRKETVTKRVQHHLLKISERLHILEGRKTILHYIDDVIQLIKISENPKEDLMDKYGLSEIQAQDVLELKLRQLGNLELDTILKEIKDLTKRQEDLQKIILTDKSLKKQIIKEMTSDMEKFGDDRMTEILEAQKIDLSLVQEKTAKISEEEVTLAISEKGWIKIIKGKKDKDEISFKEGDSLDYSFHCKNTDTLGIFDSDGKIYNYPINEITGKDGSPVHTLVQISGKFSLAFPLNKEFKYILSHDKALGFVITGENLMTKMKAGKEVFKNVSEQKIYQPIAFPISEDISEVYFGALNTENKFLAYKLTEIPEYPKGKGVVLCGLSEGHSIKEMRLIRNKSISFSVTSKNDNISEINIQKDFDTYIKARSSKGHSLPIKLKEALVKIKD